MFLHHLRRDPRDLAVRDFEDCAAYLDKLAAPASADQ